MWSLRELRIPQPQKQVPGFGGVAQVVEWLSNKLKVLSSNFSYFSLLLRKKKQLLVN
jgi:hypothetical protein